MPSVVRAGFVAEGEMITMPLSEKNLSATPSEALEQLVPITPTICGSAASVVAPVWPPSAEQPSSSFTSVTA